MKRFFGLMMRVFLAAVVMAAAVSGCGKGDKKEDEVAEIPSVRVERVRRGDLATYLDFTGEIKAWADVTVFGKVAGEIVRLEVDESDEVHEGETVMAVIDHRVIEAKVAQAEASLKMAESELMTVRKDAERIERLYKQNAATEQQYDQTVAKLKASKAQVALGEANLREARVILSDATVKAPIDGIVARRMVEKGDTVSGATALFQVMKMDPVKVIVNVGEKDLFRVKRGQHAEVRVDAYAAEVFEGSVAKIAPTVDMLSRTSAVEIEIPNAERRLKPGMFGRVRVMTARREGVFLVERDSILHDDDGSYCFVLVGDNAVKRRIRAGLNHDNTFEVTGGLQGDELIIVTGHEKLGDGELVRVIE